MDVEGAENAAFVSSVINSSESRQNEVFSPEDLAWVDSCLNKEDSDISETDWIPLRDALLEIITSQSLSLPDIEDAEILPDIEERTTSSEHNQESSTSDNTEHLRNPPSTHNVNPLSFAAETTDEILDNEKIGAFQGNPFLPTYDEDMKQNETFDIGLNPDSAIPELENASENIFKVWDLDIPSEEGELIKELKKALSENSFPTNDDSREGTLDDVIAGIADLSLNKKV